jgi:hypothetical protein
MVLQQVQMFDQQVAPALASTEQFLHLAECGGIDLPPLRMIRPAPPPRARVDAPVVLYGRRHGCSRTPLSLRVQRSNLAPAMAPRPEIASSPVGSSQ